MGSGQALTALWLVTGILMLVARNCTLNASRVRRGSLAALYYCISSLYACIFILQVIISGADLSLYSLTSADYTSTVAADLMVITSLTLLAVVLLQPTPESTSETPQPLEVPLYTLENHKIRPDYTGGHTAEINVG